MMRRSAVIAMLGLVCGSSAAFAQATATPSFNAPYRAFTQSEVGAVLGFPKGGGTDLEGMYRFAFQQLDVGLRGGAFFPGSGFNNVFLVGAEARERVISHNVQFPLDGAVVFGLGGRFTSGASALIIPAGLSLGRRLDIEGSQVSIVPYVQPTAFLISGSGATNIKFDLGLGGDFRLSKVFDARVSIGVGDAVVQGFSLAAVWVH
jgi:hypothetical protein